MRTAFQAQRKVPNFTAQPPFSSRANLLSSINPIEKQEEARKLEIVPANSFSNVFGAINSFFADKNLVNHHSLSDKINPFTTARRHAKGIILTSQEITEFCIALKFREAEFSRRIFSGDVGCFFSALIENSKDKEFLLPLDSFDSQFSRIRSCKGKTVTIIGNVGDEIGAMQKGGTLIVEGSVGYNAALSAEGATFIIKGSAGDGAGAKMSDCTMEIHENAGNYPAFEAMSSSITVFGSVWNNAGEAMRGKSTMLVKGNAGDYAGREMFGYLTIEGNAGEQCGYFMRGGVLDIKGTAGAETGKHPRGGDVFVQGKQIAKDGVRLA